MTQDVFIKAWQIIYKYRGDSSVYTWLYRIATNMSIDYLRKHKKVKQNTANFDITNYSFLLQNETLEEEVDKRLQQMKILNDCILQLPKKQQIAFVLHKIEGVSYINTAKIMGVTVSSVEGLMHRAKKTYNKK